MSTKVIASCYSIGRIFILIGTISLVMGGVLLSGYWAGAIFWGGLILMCLGVVLQWITKVIPPHYAFVIIPLLLFFIGFFWPGIWIFPISSSAVQNMAGLSAIAFLLFHLYWRSSKKGDNLISTKENESP